MTTSTSRTSRSTCGEVAPRHKYTQIGPYVVEGEWPSDEEIDRRLREGRRFSAAQVEERLRKLKEALE
jgi:hypothetical protein